MQIKMTQTRRGSENGFDIKRFHAAGIYDVADTLARYFLSMGWAKEVK